jgi:hypothetical protein
VLLGSAHLTQAAGEQGISFPPEAAAAAIRIVHRSAADRANVFIAREPVSRFY